MRTKRTLPRLWFAGVASLVLGAATGPVSAQSPPIALTGATVYPISGPPIENGVVVLSGGKIVAVGTAGSITLPPGATVRDISGKVILPGLVDTHSHLGGVAGGDSSNAIHPEVRTLDGIDIRADNFKKALAGGITTVNVMPGSGHLLSGQTVYLKLRAGAGRIEDLLLCEDALRDICGGIKMANGTNSQHAPSPPFPQTRAKSAAMMRERLTKAQEYRAKIERAGSDASKRPDRDLGLEALVEVLDGRRIVHFHTHRHDDILTVLRLAKEFGFRPVLHHVSEAWRVAEEIAQAGIPSSVIVIDAPGGKHEAVGLRMDTAAVLVRAGAAVAFHTDDAITDSRFFLRSAGLAVRAGLDRTAALEAMTINGARMLGLEDRVGSLEAGKDADLVVLSGDPLSVYTKVEQTWVEGAVVFDRSLDDQRAWATGGWEVYRSAATQAHDHAHAGFAGEEGH